MGLSKSKHKPRKGEEQKGRVYSVPKAKERPTGRHSQESEKPPDTKPAESLHGKRGAAKRQWPSSEGGRCIAESRGTSQRLAARQTHRSRGPSVFGQDCCSLNIPQTGTGPGSPVRRDVGTQPGAQGSEELGRRWDRERNLM
ncbi:spermatogenesis-associated protein 33 isoform X1 [Lynx canadensis]|uniref:spermatogenesis-associated protein 33 isoform X1 n=1 Tax=Lynx canadensis TaxID=61383 RepID=UPI0011B08374|nr:spermatogenesis-associated protein 33 isoform X1 [Lynx canadensis]